jgi:hypothetical protein
MCSRAKLRYGLALKAPAEPKAGSLLQKLISSRYGAVTGSG